MNTLFTKPYGVIQDINPNDIQNSENTINIILRNKREDSHLALIQIDSYPIGSDLSLIFMAENVNALVDSILKDDKTPFVYLYTNLPDLESIAHVISDAQDVILKLIMVLIKRTGRKTVQIRDENNLSEPIYTWTMGDLLNSIAQAKKEPKILVAHILERKREYC